MKECKNTVSAMKKFLLLIFLIILVLIIAVFTIPQLRTIIFNPLFRSTAMSYLDQGMGNNTQVSGNGAPVQSRSKGFTEPGIERIKSDLVGKKIPGWNFDRITEFSKASVSSIARTDQRIDFRLDLHMLPYNTRGGTYYDAQVFATYLAGDDDWQLSNVEEIYLSYEVTIPPGRWVTINGIPGCSMQPDTKNKLEWTSKSWDYDILSGPGIDEVTMPPASTYEVKAKAKHAIKIRLTFKPAE